LPLGGILAGLAAIIVAVYNARATERKADRDRLTAKLEELYKLILEEERSSKDLAFELMRFEAKNQEQIEIAAQKAKALADGKREVGVLIALFFPQLKPQHRQCVLCREHVVTCWYNRHNEAGTSMQIMEATHAVGISYLAIDAAIRTNAWRLCRRKKIRPVAPRQIKPV
jgi:hypothetical protein